MLLKLAVRNMRRSLRDYAIYFVTLLIAVTVFYAFNSVGDQQVMHDIAASDNTNVVEFTGYMMNTFSVVVAFVLGFLVIYANQLLISRRKREFGIYLVLGMKPGQVSRILLYETIFIGLGSLVLGLALGVLISQLLSFATAALFGIAMPQYQFSFSPIACIATLACFAAIYIVVAIFNVITVRRCKLIDLIGAKTKRQKIIIRNPWVCLVLFIVSLILIGLAYWQLDVNGMTLLFDAEFQRATVLMLVGSLLFFFSLSGFAIAVLTRLRGVYFKRLRPFTTRQVASKFNTSFVSIWVVCVLLFFAITTFATGLGLIDAFTGDIDEANPYDASIIAYGEETVYENGKGTKKPVDADISQTSAYLQQHVANWDTLVAASSQLDFYGLPDMTYGELMDAVNTHLSDAMSSTSMLNQGVQVVGLTQFNDMLALNDKQPVTLSSGEYLVTNSMSASQNIADAVVAQHMPLPTPAGDLTPVNRVDKSQLSDFDMLSNALTMVVPDDVVAALAQTETPDATYVNVMYASRSNVEDTFISAVEAVDAPGVSITITREQMVGQASGLRVMITYLAVYIGLVLLITTAAVLAIQLLSLTIDSLGRYRLLSKLGCDTRMLTRSLFEQVVIYFVAPLALAVCHSACAIVVLSESLFAALGRDLFPSIVMAACLVVAIYGGYMLITYLTSRTSVKQAIS
ncbi:MAG TPA: FtsX-like permease family protein [Coriobacteriaceae bacterium]|nr:FtsX-like permease family protein [Coriobacteriaceae bacterium]